MVLTEMEPLSLSSRSSGSFFLRRPHVTENSRAYTSERIHVSKGISAERLEHVPNGQSVAPVPVGRDGELILEGCNIS